ncbi:MAG: hypothetical protein V1791_13405, partial [Pseudomonadota bacterium]
FIFDRLAEVVKPEILVVAYDSGGSKKTYVNRARQKGIKTLHVQYSFYTQDKWYDRKRLNSEYYCLWGQAHQETFFDGDEDIKGVFITGNPTFDLHQYHRPEMRRELKLPDKGKVFTVGISARLEELTRFRDELSQAHLSGDEYFLIKLHPDFCNRTDEARSILQGAKFKHRVYGTEISPYKLLSASDYLITYHQEGLWLESYFFGTTPILIAGEEVKWAFDFLEGTSIVLESALELTRLSERRGRIDPAKLRRVRELLFHQRDFKASERVVEAMETIINGPVVTDRPLEMLEAVL